MVKLPFLPPMCCGASFLWHHTCTASLWPVVLVVACCSDLWLIVSLTF